MAAMDSPTTTADIYPKPFTLANGASGATIGSISFCQPCRVVDMAPDPALNIPFIQNSGLG